MNSNNGLADYVREVMNRKRLKAVDVQRRSRGKFSDAYVSKLLAGLTGDISIEKLQALAKGLGVSEDELFDVARGAASHAKQELLGLDFMKLSKKYMQLSDGNRSRIDVLLETIDREMDRLLEEQIEAAAIPVLPRQKKSA